MTPASRFPKAPLALFLALAAAVVGVAYAYHHVLAGTVRAEREHELLAITRLKVQQVEAFRRERLGNGRTIHENPGMSRASWPLLDRHDPALVTEHLEGWFRPLAEHYGYSDVIVLDSALRVMTRWDDGAAELPPHARALARRARDDNEVLLSDPEREPGSNDLILDLAIPLVADASGAPEHVAGVMLLRTRVADALGPMVASWPATTDTGDAFLVGRRGDRMVFLTDPRNRTTTALAEGIPLERHDSPAVEAVLGRTGIISGHDIAGVPVTAAAERVPDSSWILVSKIDTSEMMAPIRGTDRALAIAVVAILASAAVSLTLWHHRQLAASRRDALEAEAARLERQFEALFEAGNDAILLVDDRSCVVAANDRAADLYGWHKDDMLGRHAGELAGRDAADVERSFAASRERGGVVVERVHRRRDGTPFPVEASIRSYSAGGRRYALAIVRDISERKRSEAQLRLTDRLTAMGALAAGVAHEINNPLSFVLGNLEWAVERIPQGERPDAVVRALQEARDGARRVQSIVRDLKTFSRSEQDSAARKAVDVVPVLRSSLNIAQNSIRHRARLVTDLQPVRAVEASEQRLGQVFLNLLVNAVQAIPRDRQEDHQVFVGTRDTAEGVVVEVRDDGAGMSSEVQRHIFDPFYTTKPDGTGLGLSICHGIVQNLGGRIEVESTPGHGSTFRVVLPAAATAATAEADGATARTPAPVASGGRVLIVDDEPLVASSAARLLGRAHQVVTATSARDALARVDAGEDFDVIVCDLMMPGMTGMELWEALARRRPGLERRVVFVTGGTFTDRAREFLETTANTWLEKPFEPGTLRDAVAEQLVRSRSSSPAS